MRHWGKGSGKSKGVSKRFLAPVMAGSMAITGSAAWGGDEPTQDPIALPALSVTGEQVADDVVTVGSKIPVKLREVPQTVNVVSQERIEKQNLYTLEQAMKQVGGVTVQRIDANRLSFFSRGFEISSLLLDGTPTTMDNRIFLSPDLAMYERVEVLKGPAGVLNGSGSPGGSINLVRKRPLAESAVSGELSAGSSDDYRGMLDVTGPLTESGNLRGRAVVSQRDRNFYYDGGDQNSSLFYGVLEADLSPDTLLTVGANYQNVEARAAQRSLPADWTVDANGKSKLALLDVSRSNFYGADWNRDRFWSSSVFAELEQQLAHDWKAKVALRHGNSSYDLIQAYARNGFGPAGNLVSMNATRFDYREEQNEADAYVDGPFSLLGREHKLLVGANYIKSEFHDNGDYSPQFLGDVDLNDPQVDFAKPSFANEGDRLNDTEQKGIYSNVRLSLSDPLTLVLGGRLSWWDFTNTKETPDGAQASKGKSSIDQEFTPFAGLIYDLNDTYSLYTSYAEVFQPQKANLLDRSGKVIEPLEGKQWEAGIKGEYLQGALNANFALFQIEEQNRPMQDLTMPDAYVGEGKARSRGYEVELNGLLSDSWTLNANYTYTHKTYLDDSESQANFYESYLPKHILRVWTQYQLPAQWSSWSLNAGMNSVSETYNKFDQLDGAKLQQSGYTLFDAGVGYQITPQLSTDLLVTNLTDKKYYQRINTPLDGNIWGDPRTATMTLRAKF